MGQSSARAKGVMDMAATLRKWKWFLVMAGVVILAGALVYFFSQSTKEFGLGIIIPKQIAFSFDEKDSFDLSTRSLNKYDYERMTLFLLNRDLFRRYVKEIPGSRPLDPAPSYDLQRLIIPRYAVDFGSAAVRNETLQYLLFKSAPKRGVSVELLGNFALNILKNYYLLEIFRAYYNALQTAKIKYLDNQRMILDGNEKISMKIDKLREQQKKNDAGPAARGDFMLQVSAENERYLELRQQLVANEIFWNENNISLKLNRKKLARTQFMLDVVNELRRDHLDILYRDPQRAKARLAARQRQHADNELDQEFQKLGAFFDLVDSHFRLFQGDPKLLKETYLVFKTLAIFIFAFGLLLLAILALEYRNNRDR